MQAARGASLNPSDHTPPAPARRRTLFVLVAVLGFALDQATKEWALRALRDGPIDVIGDWFQLKLVFNPGAAFSLGTDSTILFTCISTVAAVVVLYLCRRVGSVLWALGLGALLAGVIGNLFDRVFRQPEPFHGHVVDFLGFGSFPVFNVADMCINVAAAVIILQSLRGIRIDGTRERDDQAVADAAAGNEHPRGPARRDEQENHR
jgi:signal peptidase II